MSRKKRLVTCLSPALMPFYDLKDTVAVVIDIFRATSTICAALGNGAEAVIPVETVDECIQLEKENRTDFITAGERDGRVIEGLKGGNSPLEYTVDVIAGKTLALTTTNGTRLLHKVKGADEIVVGSFLNLHALCTFLESKGKNILLACGGWRDWVNLEDSLFAGAVVNLLTPYFEIHDDSSFITQSLFEKSQQFPSLLSYLKSGAHYHRLVGFHLEKDMEYCCSLDKHPVVPIFKEGRLVLAPEKKPSY